MRAVMTLTLVLLLAAACGGGAGTPPIQVPPAVTGAPTSDPAAPKATTAPGGYDYGY